MSWCTVLREAGIEEVHKWKRQAEREGVSVKETKGKTRWYVWEEVGEVLGFGGYIWATKTKARIKGIYVLPENRGQGVGVKMTEGIMAKAREEGAEKLEAVALNPKFYEERGFHRTKEIRPGSWRVVYG